jgi:hypothetical protein
VAQKVQVLLVDDVDGGPAEETVTFALDGVSYEIDLNAQNAKRLRESLSPYVDHARRQGGGRAGTSRARRAGGRSSSSGNTAEIREWARTNGHKVSERGRIPQSVVEAFERGKAS